MQYYFRFNRQRGPVDALQMRFHDIICCFKSVA